MNLSPRFVLVCRHKMSLRKRTNFLTALLGPKLHIGGFELAIVQKERALLQLQFPEEFHRLL